MQNGRYNPYEASIRYCYYTAAHNGWNPKAFLAVIGFMLLMLPYLGYYKIARKTAPDLELF